MIYPFFVVGRKNKSLIIQSGVWINFLKKRYINICWHINCMVGELKYLLIDVGLEILFLEYMKAAGMGYLSICRKVKR